MAASSGESIKVYAALAALILCACGGSDSQPASPASASIAGTYHLVSINGSALPFTAQSGTTTVIVTSDVLTVADGGTWTESGAYSQTVNGATTNQVMSDGGAWSRLGTTVSFANANKIITYAGQFTGSGLKRQADDTHPLLSRPGC
jgi:hypothetical protein